MRLFLSLLFIGSSFISLDVHAWTFTARSGDQIELDWIEQHDLRQEEEVFINAFMEAYKDFSNEQLGIVDKYTFLKNAFQDVVEDHEKGDGYLLSAKLDGKVIGFAGFKETEQENEVYISQLAVDPRYWQLGVGKELVFSIFTIKKDTARLVVIPRRINEVARQFYAHLGFTVSEYMHPGYNPQKYVGYEWSKDVR
jgi:ribosomal protein S18 acetylase RimI-like enzyme